MAQPTDGPTGSPRETSHPGHRFSHGAATLTGMAVEETPDPESLSFGDHLPVTQAAIEFARERHAGQQRRADDAPFVLHPIEAASILERSGYPDHVVAAAVLHDVLEDTEAERSELEQLFGPEVAELVATVSDDPSIADTEAQKDEVRERVRRAGGYAQAVYAADKISKVRELRLLMARGVGGDTVAVRQERYRKALGMLEDAIPGSRLVELLQVRARIARHLAPGGNGGLLTLERRRLAQPHLGTGACSATSASGWELCIARRVPHSRYARSAERNSGSSGRPASSAARLISETNRARCSGAIPRPRCPASMFS